MFKEYNNYTLETREQNLLVSFNLMKNAKLLYAAVILGTVGEFIIGAIQVYMMRDKLDTDGIIIFISIMGTILFLVALWSVWYFAWSFLSKKRLQLKRTGVEYIKELSGRIKRDRYSWDEIESFISTKNKESNYLTLKTSTGKEKQLAYAMDEVEIQRLLFKLNGFRSMLR